MVISSDKQFDELDARNREVERRVVRRNCRANYMNERSSRTVHQSRYERPYIGNLEHIRVESKVTWRQRRNEPNERNYGTQ